MRRLLAAGAAVATASAALVVFGSTAAGAQPVTHQLTQKPTQHLAWSKDCGSYTGYVPNIECADVTVPLDYRHPRGKKIKIKISRVKHTSKHYQGTLLINPGGPGGSGIPWAGAASKRLDPKVAAQYDLIGFDPRGVGQSTPSLNCDKHYFAAPRQDTVPNSWRDEAKYITKAKGYAKSCKRKYGKNLLRHMNTRDTVRDMNSIRAALGQRKVSYFGYSYGTYLGSVFATMFPHKVRRMVLDSMIGPNGVWYQDNIDQDYAFEGRFTAFTDWIAKNDATFDLGTDGAKIKKLWYKMRAKVKRHPVGGKVGPSELEDTYIQGGYADSYWPDLAKAMSDYLNKGETKALLAVFDGLGDSDTTSAENGYAVYSAVEARDAHWPRNWGKWHRDTKKVYRKAPFMAWNNAWYNAPAAFWPVRSQQPVHVHGGKDLPPMLFFQATNDAATPYQGGLDMHRRFGNSRLVVELGGGNHGITMSGNKCLDAYLTAYLGTGKVPAHRGQIDATCQRQPDPKPGDFTILKQKGTAATSASGTESRAGIPASAQLARMGVRF